MFEEDEQTELVALIGEIDGRYEEIAAEFIKDIKDMSKPIVGYFAGITAPLGKSMAGAIIEGGAGTADPKNLGSLSSKSSTKLTKTLDKPIFLSFISSKV